MTKIRLYSSVYPESRMQRRRELSECLLRNIACQEIDEIIVFVEGEVDLPVHPKLRFFRVP